jgi:hypothetical protein
MAKKRRARAGGGGGNRRGRGATITEPAFEFENNDVTENFNLRPRPDLRIPVPEAQRKIGHDVYEARNILKLLKQDKALGAHGAYDEFMQRVVQAGRAGCVAPHVDTGLASEALAQIRADIVRRVGTPLAFRYLCALAGWAIVGIAFGALVWWIGGDRGIPVLGPYGQVVMGAMVGAWFSVAASRWQIAFDTIPTYLDTQYEPFVRMLFVGILATALALFLQFGALTIKFGNTDLASFLTSPGVALLLGFVAGLGERTLSVQLIERAQKILNPRAS